MIGRIRLEDHNVHMAELEQRREAQADELSLVHFTSSVSQGTIDDTTLALTELKIHIFDICAVPDYSGPE